MSVDVFGNDEVGDAELDPGPLGVLTESSVHVASVVGGEIVFAPASGSDGEFSFTYQICDTVGLCDSTTVVIIVGEVVCIITGTGGDVMLIGVSGPDVICGDAGGDVCHRVEESHGCES